jgi:cellulose synthase/poly-beta-1,6-N-acetylglucosamine synthase-like glycosyltransferase
MIASERVLVVLAILIGCAAALLLVPVTVLFVEVIVAVTHRRREQSPSGPRPRLSVIVPAHNEAAVIGATLRSILPQLTAPESLLVVADNCSDDTARIARSEGARVIERTDARRRGKGYAIDHALRSLAREPPEVVIVIDADCNVAAGAIDRLARHCSATRKPVQALYLMRAPRTSNLRLRIAQLAWLVRNQVRPMGLHRMHLPCHLMGTGMAFPWICISQATVATGHIVEDLQLGIELARMGSPPLFCPEALVTSEFPTSREGIRTQRLRWEHGHLATLLSEAPSLLLQAIRRGEVRLASLALDLSVPPIALLSLLVAAVTCVSAGLFVFAKVRLPLCIGFIELSMVGCSIIVSWARYGRAILSFGELACAPLYALWKVPVYGRFLVGRQRDWIRSRRD